MNSTPTKKTRVTTLKGADVLNLLVCDSFGGLVDACTWHKKQGT